MKSLTLKTKFYSLTWVLHGLLFGLAYSFLHEQTIAFFVTELVLLTSLVLFLLLIKKVLAPFEFIQLFSHIVKEQEFNNRFSETGNQQLDQLMALFNRMLTQLYDERIKLGDRQGMLQQLLNSVPLAVVIFDYDQRISQLNPAAETLFSTKSEKLKQRYLEHISHPLIQPLAELENNHSKLIGDNTGKRYRCSKNSFRDRGFDRQFIIIHELTNELHSLEKNTYEKLIRLMSHEVNNTMAATSSLLKSCLSYAEQIDSNEREEYRHAMELVIARTENLNQFMKDYANIVRLPEPTLERCNLHHLLMAIEHLFSATLQEQGIGLTLNCELEDTPDVFVDKNQLEQAIINIIRNAIDAVANNASDKIIRITLTQQSQQLSLQISDNGAGLPDNSATQLFTPFFTTKVNGQGLGLMLVREILDAHHVQFSIVNNKQLTPNATGVSFTMMFNI